LVLTVRDIFRIGFYIKFIFYEGDDWPVTGNYSVGSVEGVVELIELEDISDLYLRMY
jgi:hypothetical protein